MITYNLSTQKTFMDKLFTLLLICFVSFNINLPGQGRNLSLKHVVHRPIEGYTNPARLVKADARGGAIDFDVTYANGGLCTETYRVQWKFDQDMSFLKYEENSNYYDFEIRTQVINGNCGKIQPWRNPFVIAVANDVSTSSILMEQGYDEVSMAQGIFGGSSDRLFTRDDEWVRFNQARQGFVRGRFHTKKDLNSYGKYTWFKFTIIGNSNHTDPKASFQYEIVYVYDVNGAPDYVNVNTLTLDIPEVVQNQVDQEGRKGMWVRVPGELAPQSGKQFRLQARFETSTGQELKGNNLDQTYVDNRGYASAVSPLYFIPPGPYRLEQIALWVPYYALQSNARNRQQLIYVFMELWVDGKIAARSPKVPIQVD